MQSFSMADTGSETLAADESLSGSLTVATESNQFDLQDAFSANSARGESWNFSTSAYSALGSDTLSEADAYSFDDVGNNSLSGSSSTESDSYEVSDWEYASESVTNAGNFFEGTYGTGTYVSDSDYFRTYSLSADGTDSVSGGHDVSTMSDNSVTTSSLSDSLSYSLPVAYGQWDLPGGTIIPGCTFDDYQATGGYGGVPSWESYSTVTVGPNEIYPGPFTWTSTESGSYAEAGITSPEMPVAGGVEHGRTPRTEARYP